MRLGLGDTAPDFRAETTLGTINFHDWMGDSWVVFFSHPADYTPVCTTELGATAKLREEFARRNTKVVALSVDPLNMHNAWISDINQTQSTTVDFPIIADEDHSIATLYGMIHPNMSPNVTVRSVFIIGPDKKIKLTMTYPSSTGRNFQEILRVIDSLQLTAHHAVATPANWNYGDDCIIAPNISNKDAKDMFPKGWNEIRPYLRLTPQPDL